MASRFALILLLLSVTLVGCSSEKPTATTEEPVAEQAHPDYKNIQGIWKIVSSERNGEPNEEALGNFFTFEENYVTVWLRDFGDLGSSYELDPEKKHFTVKMGSPPNDRIYTAIYELDGDNLKVCFKDRERPTGFTTTAENKWTSHKLERTASME